MRRNEEINHKGHIESRFGVGKLSAKNVKYAKNPERMFGCRGVSRYARRWRSGGLRVVAIGEKATKG
jgi:hypothetical protein